MSSKKITRKTRIKDEIPKVLKVHFNQIYLFSQGFHFEERKKKSLEKWKILEGNFLSCLDSLVLWYRTI